MGIEVQSVRLLLLASELGVDFANTLTIGRQRMMVSETQLKNAFEDFGKTLLPSARRDLAGVADPFTTALFSELGARSVDALDYSDYEGASFLQDLNAPLAQERDARFSVVFDGGTLEHVFNLPTALATLMRLPQVGGHIILALPANNDMGHGFYQFSPELFFRSLAADNGYRIKAMFLAPMFCRRPWLMVRDPAQVRRRVGHSFGNMPTYIFVIAQRISALTPFALAPQQSDYTADWEAADKTDFAMPKPVSSSNFRARIKSLLPEYALDIAREIRANRRRPDPRDLVSLSPDKNAAARVQEFFRPPLQNHNDQ